MFPKCFYLSSRQPNRSVWLPFSFPLPLPIHRKVHISLLERSNILCSNKVWHQCKTPIIGTFNLQHPPNQRLYRILPQRPTIFLFDRFFLRGSLQKRRQKKLMTKADKPPPHEEADHKCVTKWLLGRTSWCCVTRYMRSLIEKWSIISRWPLMSFVFVVLVLEMGATGKRKKVCGVWPIFFIFGRPIFSWRSLREVVNPKHRKNWKPIFRLSMRY